MPVNVKQGLWVALAGFFGGILFYFLSLYSNTIVFGSLSVWSRFLPCGVLGAGAALAGVFFITDTDPAKAHTLVFAMLCGILWQPVLSSAQRMAANSLAGSTAQNTDSAAKELNTALTTATPDQVQQKIAPAADAVAKSVQALAAPADVHAKRQLMLASRQGIKAITAAWNKAPVETVDALQRVGAAAVKSNQPEVASEVRESLLRVKASDNNPIVQAKIGTALQQLPSNPWWAQ